MEMQFKNEIKKLADIVVWADNLITSAGFDVEKYKEDGSTAYCHVKAHELWKIKTVVLESMERHSVYTNALNKDIAAKAAKIDLMQKELDGRKAGYAALKARMDSEIEKLKKELDGYKDRDENAKDRIIGNTIEIENLKKELDARGEEIKKLNKCIMNKNESINTGNEAIINLRKEIGAHVEENKKLENRIKELKNAFSDLREEMANRYIPIETHNDICKTYEINDTSLKKQVEYLKKELEDTYRTKEADLKNHNKRDMTLVDELAKKNDEIKKLKEERDKLKSFLKMQEDLTRDWKNKYVEAQKEIDEWESDTTEHETIIQYQEFIDGLNKDLNYWKDQERIRTDQLRATERKVDELWGLVNELKKEKKEGDDYAKSGFKLYVKNALIEAEGDKNEANEIITEAVRSAYSEWDKTQKENEKTIKKAIKEVMNKKFGYAWEIAVRIRSEVDKKRIVDISEGAERILGVSRELFDDAVRALNKDDYHEYEGVVTGYGRFHVLTTPDIEFKDLYDTWKIRRLKSIDSDIPCGEDSIE